MRRIIPARQRVGNRKKDEERPKLRVAAYCRVSTDSDEQATSYEAQIEHYTAYIQKNPEWELAGIFADDGLSGTDTRKREQFNLLIEECMAGKIDMVITKSISRFGQKHLGLPEIYPTAKGQEYSRVFREGKHQHDGFKGRNPADHHGITGTTGKPVFKPEREARLAVPIPAGACAGQPQPLPRLALRMRKGCWSSSRKRLKL